MNAVQAAQRLLDYIGNMGLYVDAHTYSEAFPKRLHRLFMKIHSVMASRRHWRMRVDLGYRVALPVRM